MQNNYAGFWNRALAISLDQIILGIFTLFFLMQFMPFIIDYAAIKSAPNKDIAMLTEMLGNLVFIEIIGVVIWSAICAYFYTTRWQATPGKKIMGMKVVKLNGNKLSFKDGFLRTASLPIFVLMLQIFERSEIYSKLEEIKTNSQNHKSVEELIAFITSSSTAGISNLLVITLGGIWLLLAAFTREKTAFHDILFDTRVIYDKK